MRRRRPERADRLRRLEAGIPEARQRLLRELKAHDPQAIELLFVWAGPRLKAWFRQCRVEPSDPESMTQDVLIAFAWRWVDTVRSPSAIGTYRKCMCRTRLDRMNRYDTRCREWTPDVAEPDDPPARLHGVVVLALTRCLAQLTDRIRGRLQKHFQLGMNGAEIGRSEGCTGQAVNQSIDKALRSLRACMETDT